MSPASGVPPRGSLPRRTVPEELSARGPGPDRDAVRLLVSRGTAVAHHASPELPRLPRAGDLLVVNTSPMPAAAVDGRATHARACARTGEGEPLQEAGSGGVGGLAGTRVGCPGEVRPALEEPPSARGERLWWSAGGGDVLGLPREYGRSLRCSRAERDRPPPVDRTVFAPPAPGGAGGAEMPGAARPFTARTAVEPMSRGWRSRRSPCTPGWRRRRHRRSRRVRSGSRCRRRPRGWSTRSGRAVAG
ncbi:S-adenosylmethionine:tRNA ribosyltransferase-isomerase [Streptomyces sp. NPDC085946]|uniref:S-adenosylmethionine:tRNA ribosyltransferase-isomerase n=1 Tax=Streptomyces sp. NPDC085946 TaxID=3365744 RepID=UPI0037D7F65A